MAHFEIRRCTPSTTLTGLPRKDRQSCDYSAYCPDTLGGRLIMLDGDVAADVADAERAVVQLDTRARALVDTEALARLLLRAESVASSRIEGLEIGARRLLHADAARAVGEPATDVTAGEVLANIDAMTFATNAIAEGDWITVDLLLEIHRRLLTPTHLSQRAGTMRTEQIGSAEAATIRVAPALSRRRPSACIHCWKTYAPFVTAISFRPSRRLQSHTRNLRRFIHLWTATVA